MTWTMALQDVRGADGPLVGDKSLALARLHQAGLQVPQGLCVTIRAYNHFLDQTGLRDRIQMELSRKAFADMRWEEMWDAALRIRNMFLTVALPGDLDKELMAELGRAFSGRRTVVRSSAPGEDGAQSSFAGLHESYVNVSGQSDLLTAVRKVWASLFSDGALLYRKELGLDPVSSSMAVLVQEIVLGECSGVVFTQSPEDEAALVVEAVHGLNQGLVDGAVEPDRWTVDRQSGKLLSSSAPERDVWIVPTADGTAKQPLEADRRSRPPLEPGQLTSVTRAALQVEATFGRPQDMEWTIRDGRLQVLQSRPITTGRQSEAGDQRGWYLSLRRSLENLTALRSRIEGEILPEMAAEAGRLGEQDLAGLSDHELAEEILRREEIHQHWVRVYWDECIPFAHGARLFGQIYNDALRPTDPFEFVQLLGSDSLLSLERNGLIESMAAQARKNPDLLQALEAGDSSVSGQDFQRLLDDFLDRFGELFCHQASCTQGRADVLALVAKLARHRTSGNQSRQDRVAGLETVFFKAMGPQRQAEAREVLDLARASYRLRDDDNIYLGRIEAQLLRAAQEGQSRMERKGVPCPHPDPGSVAAALTNPERAMVCQEEGQPDQPVRGPVVRPRQILGQPAGPGVIRGRARVIHTLEDLRFLESGEILVCDAIDPNMTAMVVLAAGIVERRGGMLIHGAIIAREYGLPCVTGVPGALEAISTGEVITVDGYLGIVTLA